MPNEGSHGKETTCSGSNISHSYATHPIYVLVCVVFCCGPRRIRSRIHLGGMAKKRIRVLDDGADRVVRATAAAMAKHNNHVNGGR